MTSLELQSEVMEQRNIHLQKKYDVIKENEVRFEKTNLDDADYVIVAFGSVARISEKAVELAREEGIKALPRKGDRRVGQDPERFLGSRVERWPDDRGCPPRR